jgi:hypothetical protein
MTLKKLLNVVGGKDLEDNFKKIAESMSAISYRYPVPNENILSQGGVYAYPVTVDTVTTTYEIDSTGTSIDSIAAGTSSGCTYKIKPKGEVKKIASATSTAIFGASTYTHCMLILVELPTLDFGSVKVKLGSGAAATLTKDNVIMGDDVCYYVLPLGLYDNSGTTASYSTYTIEVNGNSIKNEFDVSGVTLEA